MVYCCEKDSVLPTFANVNVLIILSGMPQRIASQVKYHLAQPRNSAVQKMGRTL